MLFLTTVYSAMLRNGQSWKIFWLKQSHLGQWASDLNSCLISSRTEKDGSVNRYPAARFPFLAPPSDPLHNAASFIFHYLHQIFLNFLLPFFYEGGNDVEHHLIWIQGGFAALNPPLQIVAAYRSRCVHAPVAARRSAVSWPERAGSTHCQSFTLPSSSLCVFLCLCICQLLHVGEVCFQNVSAIKVNFQFRNQGLLNHGEALTRGWPLWKGCAEIGSCVVFSYIHLGIVQFGLLVKC